MQLYKAKLSGDTTFFRLTVTKSLYDAAGHGSASQNFFDYAKSSVFEQ
jgi:hypothetical protein